MLSSTRPKPRCVLWYKLAWAWCSLPSLPPSDFITNLPLDSTVCLMSLLRHPLSDLLQLAKTYEFPMETSPPTWECNVTILSVFPECCSVMVFFFCSCFSVNEITSGTDIWETCVFRSSLHRALLAEVSRWSRQGCMSKSSKVNPGRTNPT